MRRVQVRLELAGLFLARNVYDASGKVVLVRQGTRLDAPLLQAMLRRGIQSIWVTDQLLPDLEVHEAVTEETRSLTRAVLAKTLAAFRGREVTPQHLQALQDTVQHLVGEILANQDVSVNITHLRSWDNYTYEHSVQVAILSIIIGREIGLSRYQLHRLGTGALLHDLGKVAVSREVLNKPGPLTPAEWEEMKAHCRVGWDLLQEHPSIMPTSAIVVLQHHERLDGSGYPSGLKDPAIHVHAKVAAVADVFDAMRADRVYRRRASPQQVVQELSAAAGPKLHAEMVRVLLRRVALVPQGEIVRLTNDLVGVVVANNPGFPLEPEVVVFGTEHEPMSPQQIDLKGSGVQVQEILDDWPEPLLSRLPRRPTP